MKLNDRLTHLSRRDFIREIAVDTAAIGLAGSLAPFALGQTATPAAWTPSDAPNQPVGIARGIFPGRVAWVRDSTVARWDGKTGHWWDEGNIDQQALEAMWSRSLRGVSGAHDDRAAWNKIFH